MSCFYSISGSEKQKPQKREPREVISRKPIMRKQITDSIGSCIFLFDKTEEMSPFVSFNLNTGISFLAHLVNFLAGNLMIASIK